VSNLKAQEGQWYLQRWSRETFCVIGVDEDFRVIDVRDENGDVDEFAFDEWETMDLEVCAAPSGQRGGDESLGDDAEFDDFEPLSGLPMNGHSMPDLGPDEDIPPTYRNQ
jgi:hypothetical protein